jgi:hypothetical protein
MNRAVALLSTSLITVSCAIGLSAVPASAAAPATSEPNLPCGSDVHDLDFVTPTFVLASGANVSIRTGTTSECSIIGSIGVGEAVNYDCWVHDAIGRLWTHLHTSEGERGWTLNSSLPVWRSPRYGTFQGSYVHC